jgi:uncharacterized protein YdhG (YjbR/CyaY superfamily)
MLSAMPKGSRQDEVRAYYAALPVATRRRVRELRAVILGVAPDAEESISYRIPAFKLDGRVLVYCAGWKEHTSLYPLTAGMKQACARDLEKFETSKGTVRFPAETRLPVAVITRLVKARVAEIRGVPIRRRAAAGVTSPAAVTVPRRERPRARTGR